jgi:hypothetical protein
VDTRGIAIHQENYGRNGEAKDPLVEANVFIHPTDDLDEALGISYGICHLFQKHRKQRELSVIL